MTEQLKQAINALQCAKRGHCDHAMADEAIAALERALTTSQPAQAGEVDERVAPRWTVFVEPVAVSGEPDAHCLRASIGNQAFHIGPDYMETKQEAEFFAEMFLHAIEVGHRASLPTQPAAQAAPEPTVTYATVRDADDELHIECRFSDGQKFAAVTVAQGFDNLAHRIETMLNEAHQATPEPVRGCIACAARDAAIGQPPCADVPQAYLEWLATKSRSAGVGGNEAWNAGVEWQKQQPPQQAAGEPVGEQWQKRHPEATGGEWINTNEADANWLRDHANSWEVRVLYTHPAPGVPEGVRAALEFYASGNHFVRADAYAWETVSGEPPNFWEDDANTATVEDGTVARNALAAAQAKGGQA